MPPLKRPIQETNPYDEVVSAKKQVPVEKHDSLFLGPLGELFSSKPHNDTFVENRYTKIQSIPADNSLSQTFTFSYRGTSFGLIKTNDATLEADLQLVNSATNAALPAGYNAGIVPFPLRTMWKSKEIMVNDQLVNNLTNNDHLIAWIRHLTTEIKKNWFDSKLIHLGEHDTTGHFDNVTYIGTASDKGTEALAVGNIVPTCKNVGLRNRARVFTLAASTIKVIDTLDTVCFNENGTDKYFPSDFDLRVILHRNPTNKYIRGYTGAYAALGVTHAGGVDTADVAITNFYLKLPMFKPKDQIAAAINRTMVTNDKECIFYTMHYRLVTRTIAAGASRIQEQDIFTGSRPTRVFFALYSQTRWNGGFGSASVAINIDDDTPANVQAAAPGWHNPTGNHPLRAIMPNFNYCALRINEAIVQPEYRNSKEAYMEFRRMLNRSNRPMPFDYSAYLTDYGWIAFDLSPNKDSFNEVLPNATSGNVSFEITFLQALNAVGSADIDAAGYQALFIAEFRNEVKVGYNTPARKIYDF